MEGISPRRVLVAALLTFVLALSGCIGSASAPAKFYMLSPMPLAMETSSADTGVDRTVIGIEPVQVAQYLDRPQVVTTRNNTEFFLDEFTRWTEPLSDNFTRVIAENLSSLLSDQSIDVFPTVRSVPTDYTVSVAVLRMDGTLGGQVTLIARWSIFGSDQDELLATRRTRYQETGRDNTYGELVLAKSRMVETLSRDIALALKKTLPSR